MGSSAADLTRQLLRHQRTVLACTVLLLAGLGWAFLLRGMPMGAMEPSLVALVAMWWLMMLAMMLPSATPAILLYARVRETRDSDSAIAPPWLFVGGYLLVWLLFSIAAAVAQLLLIDASAAIRNQAARSFLLILAGLYQFSPMKSACISQCRSPAQFISHHWRSGWQGAMRLGVIHGAYCVGCCWMLMALLFAGGVMSIAWVIGLTVLVTAEKLLPMGLWVQRVSGCALVLWGLVEASR